MNKARHELKIWAAYFGVILCSVYIHEVGHCVPAWVNGYWAVPTPAKEYASSSVPAELEQYMSLGGILGTILVAALGIVLYMKETAKVDSVVLAGVIASSGSYSLRFLLLGRGHGDTEFQNAQAALGFSYEGHALDWIFLGIFLVGAGAWIIRSRPGIRIVGRLVVGVVLTFIFMVVLQSLNNAIFDPIFQSSTVSDRM